MKLLVTGGHGQIGWELSQIQSSPDCTIKVCSRTELDITDSEQISKIIDAYQPDMVINTAAYTAVDKAESEKKQAFNINREGVERLARICHATGVSLLHLSTDYVFAGDKTSPYRESDPPVPLNVYGTSKWAGELVLEELLPRHLILRISSVFSRHGHNFLKTMLRLAEEREQMKIVSDQRMCPTYGQHIANTIMLLSEKIILGKREDSWGIYHYSDLPVCTWFDFANAIIQEARQYRELKVKEVIPISATQYPTPAKRPSYTVLNCEKIFKTFNIVQENWQIGVKKVVKSLLST